MSKGARIAREALYWLVIAALLTAGGFLLFTNLGEAGISDCDEARHGINAYEMLQSGDWVVSTYRGEPDYWNLKPPLTYYCIAAGFETLGYNAFGMRFYSAMSMLLTMIVLALWTKRRFGSLTSVMCQLFWLGCSMVYGAHFARFGDADAQMLMFYVFAMLCMLQSERSLNWLYGTALCFGLAFMSKSWHAALIPVTCLAYLCVTGEIRRLRPHHYILLIVFGLLPIAPWVVARYQRDGLDFLLKSFTKDVGRRATTVIEGHYGEPLYYVNYLWSNPAVRTALALAAAGALGKVISRTRVTRTQWGLALWFAVPLLMYSLCVSKLRWYIFVSLPPLAIALGLGARKLMSLCAPRGKAALAAGALCVAGVMYYVGFLGVQNWNMVSNVTNVDGYQLMLWEYFDRDFDEGTRIYVQYESENDYYEVDYRRWVQDDLLTAMLAGGLECMDGGIDAFLEEEEHAYLICHKVGMEWEILESYPIVMQDGRLMLVENLV